MNETYHCWDDCTPAGCPGHVIDVSLQRSVDLLTFWEDGRERFLVSRNCFLAMVKAYEAKYSGEDKTPAAG